MISAMFSMPPRRRTLCVAASLAFGFSLAPANPPVGQEAISSQNSLAVASSATSSARAAAAKKSRPDVALFRARVEAALSEAHAQKALWGVLVADRDTGETLFEQNADRFFTPASNAKIFTSALALATLGRDYRFHTTLESPVMLDSNGLLAGDLVLVGRGDPDLSNRKFPYAGKAEREGPVEKIFAELADEAVAKGLKEIDGDVVGDDTYFPYDPYPAGWSVGDLFFTFGAPVSAIAFNDNSFSIAVQPGALPGDPAIIAVEPEAAQDTFARELVTVPSEGKPDFAVTRRPGTNFILLRGTIPAGHVPMNLDLAIAEPAETAARTLKRLLETRGVRVTGGIRVVHAPPPDTSDARDLPPAPATAPAASASDLHVLAEHVSQPLLESVRLMNKISQNLHAELLLRTVAREKTGIGSAVDGLKVEQGFLKAAGVADADVALSDGSGLSRDDLVTPRSVITLLRYAAHQPWGEDYLSTLPIAGVDGTLENRMKATSASGLIHAKTGALEHVRGMSGYATTLRGEHLVFSIFGNNNPEHGHDATEALDAIGVAMVETLGVPVPAKSKKKK
jgi:D-alanyl-D-alanine carboxypeptidase/D-alanyl-D-alanine-endopeptidase (penicillin-binding protein 4)